MPFTLQQEKHISEINTSAKVFIHNKTGARLLSLTNSDENKCFGISFRTPTADSTGVAHIMEHAVLCGSRKYPVKKPFVELGKGSLNTFMNAYTYPDKTSFPVASQNLRDFYNLIDVYLDAVFYPLLLPEIFRQEGWHYEIESPDAALTYKGVVFNEMKGSYSSPDNILSDLSQQSIFPDNLYGFDSGGNPTVIPDLTYAQFKAFHERYYHPSNSFIYFYGDDPEEERLRLLDPWLDAFDKKEIHSEIPLQPKFSVPRMVTAVYDAGDNPRAKAYVQLNWLMPEVTDVQTTLAIDLLTHILLGTPAAPLKRALRESGLGEDVTGGYLSSAYFRQAMFSAGMKGVAIENLENVEKRILETLRTLASEGLDSDTVAASLNTIEFRLRERNAGRFPRGLVMMLSALGTWVYNGDPVAGLVFDAPLAFIRAEVAKGRFFESLIEEYLLNNLHRSSVRLLPDPKEGKRREAAETERLEKAKSAMSADELREVISDAAALKQRQETPDSPESLASLPVLKLSDLDKNIHTIPIEELELSGVKVIHHALFSNNILYLDLGFDLHSLPEDLLLYAGLFGRLLLEMGTEKDDFVKLTQRIGCGTGGIRPSALTSTVRETGRSVVWLFLRGKVVVSQASALFEVLRDILLSTRLDNRERFRQIVLEEKAGMEAKLVPNGHRVINQRLRAHFSEADWVAEQMSGITQLLFLRKLAEATEKDWASVLEKLEMVRRLLLNPEHIIANVTIDKTNWQAVKPLFTNFLEQLGAGYQELMTISSKLDTTWNFQRATSNEGLTIPTQVNYVGKGLNLYAHGYKLHGSVQVINNYLGGTWLWEKIRVQGGAYGGFSPFDVHSGIYTFLSYRDPNLLASLDNYDGTAGFLSALHLSEAELTKSIIGTIGDLDAYLLPDTKGWVSLTRHLIGYTDEKRQQLRKEVFATSAKDFTAFADILAEVARRGDVVVLGSAEAIEKANAERKGLLDVKKIL